MKAYQRRPQSFRKTTKQERMQKYYEHIQAKYSGRTSLVAPSKPQPKSPSGSVVGDVRGNNTDLIQMMGLSTPKAPLQRIGNFSYPRKAWQSPELSSDATTVCHDEPNEPLTNGPRAPESSKYHNKFSGKSLPKWNQLYRAYHGSS